jgi:NAD(P)-dependent dehydrogenase (short-subunit alcohol dehydrogenase family)
MQTLKDKVAVITGGASGIGYATAKLLASHGTHLMLTDIEPDALNEAVESLRPLGVKVEGFVCDVGNLEQMKQLADAAFERMGAVHILFNNAGIAVGGPILEMTHADWEWTLQVDLWGPIHGVEVFLSRMVEQGEEAHVLFTASFAGLTPNEGLGPYCVAKYGVVALAEVLKKEMRNKNIGVSVLCPMRVGTNIGYSERNRQDAFGGPVDAPPLPTLEEDNPNAAGSILGVDEVAELVVKGIQENQLYLLPHEESREFIRRRFDRIDSAFE